MSADVSGVGFDARDDYSGVVMQQGRLLRDVDWNTLDDLVDRRLRAQAADLGSLGPRAGEEHVAVVPRTTPDGFHLTLSGTTVNIGRGRMYVDGVLAENHGLASGPWSADPILDDQVSSTSVTYGTQPYGVPADASGNPAALPTTGTHLAYLDVWEREVGYVQAPELVDPALGVDTTARTQTVWQLRFLPDDTPGIDCATLDSAIAPYAALIAPSAARLTTGVVAVAADDDLCSIAPSSTYRGAENQTYRVQVHRGGALGTAQIKWSRDDASIVIPVSEVPDASTVVPASMGRDEVLGLQSGGWVEFLDDRRELDGRGGVVRKITVTGDHLTLSAPLPADLVMSASDAAARHFRIVRWDQSGQIKTDAGTVIQDLDAGSDGVVTTTASAIVLESGITIRLSIPSGQTFRAGDYWIFTARVATGRVEELTDAPPLGIRHRYARLGVYQPAASPAPLLSDCRVLWPPDTTENVCCCTVCVTPDRFAHGLTLQDALAEISAMGGTLCLHTGEYTITSTLAIDGVNAIRVHGHTPGVVITSPDVAIAVKGSSHIAIEDLTVTALSGSSAIEIVDSSDVELRGLELRVANPPAPAGGGGGAPALTADVPGAITLRGAVLRARVERCALFGAIGVLGGRDDALVTSELTLADLEITAASAGVLFGESAVHLISSTLRGLSVDSTGAAGIADAALVDDACAALVAECVVRTDGDGIRVGTGGWRLDGNTVGRLGKAVIGSAGVLITPHSTVVARGRTSLAGNRVDGDWDAGVRVASAVTALQVTDNTIVSAGLRGMDISTSGSDLTVDVRGNTVRGVGALRHGTDFALSGIMIDGCSHAMVRCNTVREIGHANLGGGLVSPYSAHGILLIGVDEAAITDNLVESITVNQIEAPVAGIVHAGGWRRLSVSGNTVRHGGGEDELAELNTAVGWTGIDLGPNALLKGVAGSQPLKWRPTVTWTEVALAGAFAFATVAAEYLKLLDPKSASSVTVSGNSATGGIRSSACIVPAAHSSAVIEANTLRGVPDTPIPPLIVSVSSATVTSNRVAGMVPGAAQPTIALDVAVARLAAVANVTSNGIGVGTVGSTTPLAPPWAPLNITGVTLP